MVEDRMCTRELKVDRAGFPYLLFDARARTYTSNIV